MNDEHDSNDVRLITFSINPEDVDWIDKKLATLKEYDPGFYVQIIDLNHKQGKYNQYIYKISTHQSNLEHEAFKKFIFQLGLKLGGKLKIR